MEGVLWSARIFQGLTHFGSMSIKLALPYARHFIGMINRYRVEEDKPSENLISVYQRLRSKHRENMSHKIVSVVGEILTDKPEYFMYDY